jgi:predicted alpha/beta superfamily hydrolase
MRSIVAVLVLALGCVTAASAQTPTVKSEAPVTFPTWQQIVLTSPSLKRDFMVRVIPPVIPPASGQKIAAIYLLDGNLYSGMAADTMRLIALDGPRYASAYVIAIGYDTTNPMVVIQNRQNDYLRVKTVEPGKTTSYGGGGAAFETFLVDELKPYLETRLPIDPTRSYLAGHSYGGLFTANLAAHRPEQFAGYAIGSPSIWADRDTPKMLEAQKGDKRKAFVSVGGLEAEGAIDMVKDAGAVADAMSKAGFVVEKRVYAGQDHGASPNAFLADSFRYLLLTARP